MRIGAARKVAANSDPAHPVLATGPGTMLSNSAILTGVVMPTAPDGCYELSHRPLSQRQTALFHRLVGLLGWLAFSAVESVQSVQHLCILLSRLAENFAI